MLILLTQIEMTTETDDSYDREFDKEVEESKKRAVILNKRLAECTKDKFNKLFQIYPKGNPENAWVLMRFHVASEKTWDEHPVTFALIEKKWEEYIKKCFTDGTAEKYIKSLESFIKNKDYNVNFSPSANKGSSFLDKYK